MNELNTSTLLKKFTHRNNYHIFNRIQLFKRADTIVARANTIIARRDTVTKKWA
jgi:hypothetical protein